MRLELRVEMMKTINQNANLLFMPFRNILLKEIILALMLKKSFKYYKKLSFGHELRIF